MPTSTARTPLDAPVVVEDLLHDGGIVVFRGRTADGHSLRAVARRALTGQAPQTGDTWHLCGEWREHPKYGWQVEVQTAIVTRPAGQMLVSALALGKHFRGIGVVRAQKLWEKFGMKIFDLLDAGDRSPFLNVLGPELADHLVAGWRVIDETAKAYRWLVSHGFPAALGRKVIEIYSGVPVPSAATNDAAGCGRVVWHIESDPYRMLAFASWSKVEDAARRLKVGRRDPRRLVGAAESVFATRLADGHTWMADEALAKAVALRLQEPISVGVEAIQVAARKGTIVRHAGGYQGAGTYLMERYVADRFEAMLTGRSKAQQLTLFRDSNRTKADVMLDNFEVTEGYSLNAEQRAGVCMALTEPLSTMVGGPGVGKTTVLKAVHIVAESSARTVYQTALSGRAAQRMAEATGRPASTIAAMLVRIEKGELALDHAPLVIIDESSMLDLSSLYRLLRRFPPGVSLLFVGDPGQLPPVGFGLTFHILASDTRVPRTVLTTVMRQTHASGIPDACAAIREGRTPSWAQDDKQHVGVRFIDAAPEDIVDVVIDCAAQAGGIDAVQIIGSVKNGPGGVHDINDRLHALLSPGRETVAGQFYIGEPVIATQNDYEVGVMNGELGVVLGEGDDGGLRCKFDAGIKLIPHDYLPHLAIAYAITCHKSQGSEFPRVIVPVTRSRLLDRTLLLTAVSRGKEEVILVGDRDAFAAAVTAPASPSLREVGFGRLTPPTAEESAR